MRSATRLPLASLMSASALCLALAAPQVAAEGTLNVYNWADYIGDDTIANFEKEFNVEVVYDNYDSVETVDAKLLAGSSGYDVVSHAGSAIGRLAPAGILQKLDKSRLPNWKHLREDILEQLSMNWDPGNAYVVPFMWGTHGVTYNPELVKAVAPDVPIGSMDMIFRPEHMEKLSKCGVAFLDSPTDIIPMALAYLGLDPASTDKADYKKVEELLMPIRPYIKTFDNYAYQRMLEKEFCVCVTWGPDGLLAVLGAEEADVDITLEFFHPPGKGAANFWVDGWVIPADAKNVENAHLFLNYMMRPEVAAADSNSTYYANANKDSFDMVDPVLLASHAAYPPPEAVADMYPLANVPRKIQRVRTRTWTNFRAGKK